MLSAKLHSDLMLASLSCLDVDLSVPMIGALGGSVEVARRSPRKGTSVKIGL